MCETGFKPVAHGATFRLATFVAPESQRKEEGENGGGGGVKLKLLENYWKLQQNSC